jgi:tRNA A-37 threonylcarbamoyl transferase component Bud32
MTAQPVAPQLAQANRRFRVLVAVAIAALAVMSAVGAWSYWQMRESLREVRASGLASLLEAQTRHFELWIAEKKRDAERWANTPQVQQRAAALAAGGQACAGAAQRALREELAPIAAAEGIATFNLVARDGRIVASSRAEDCGRAVSPAFLARLAPALEGRSLLIPPLHEADWLGAAASASAHDQLTWIETPVRAADGTVVATLGLGRRAREGFAQLVALDIPGTSRDAFAFDATGRMVTETRHARLGTEVRSPEGQYTALAEAAMQRHEGAQGMLLEPYRNHRGVEVIGAWRWLPEKQIALAVEIDAAEAYGPLEYLQVAFGVLFALLIASTVTAAGASLWAARLGLREAERVGPYRIERQLGEGGMSNVYLATHEQLRRPAAVKVLKLHMANEEVVARFRREAQLTSLLTHPNTIEVYDYGHTRDGRWYYAMEYLEGIALENLVRRDGPLPVGRVLHLLRQACSSLAEAHARGWVHRDVKPGNLIVCVIGGQHDVLKVVDFGLIKQVRNPHTRDLTQFAKTLGTPLYMAPERLRNPADADARADIYALGTVAWFALAARAPFHSESDHDIVYRILNDPAPTLAEAGVSGVPQALELLIARCLAKEREARPDSIEEMRAALEALAVANPWTEDDARACWTGFSPKIT